MNVNYKKSTKILMLLLSSILIASVSAQVYRYMYINGSVTVGAAKLVWLAGSNAPSGYDITGSTATIDLDVEPGTPVNITEVLFLENQDSSAHNLTISVTTAITAADFTDCKMYIYENTTTPGTWTFVDTLDIKTLDSYETYTGNTPLGAGNFYKMDFEVYPTASASGTYNYDIQVEYE
jgi:hypothetical protein